MTHTVTSHHLGMPEVLRLRTDDLDWLEVEGEVVVLDLRTSTYVAVNQTGTKLWTALQDGATHEQLVDVLAVEFGVPRERAVADIDAFLESLKAQDLLLQE